MIIEGYCKQCHNSFDAHWHNYPKEYNMTPYCLACKSYDVITWTDEMCEYENPELQYEEEDL